MRAVQIDPSERALRVVDLPDPVVGPGQLLVRVRAAGLNRADLIARAGRYVVGTSAAGAPPPVAKPFTGGGELAGEVVAVGDGVTGWSVGDRVMSQGLGYAELAVVNAALAMPVPESLSWEEAGALPVALLTMHDALVTNGRWQPGESVCVHAVTSGVGVVGAQMALLLGAPLVLGTSRSADKRAAVSAYLDDARLVAVDPAELVTEARARTEGRGVDVTLDNVGANVLEATLETSAILGRIVQIGRLGGRTGTLDLDELARKRVSLIGVTFRTRTAQERQAVRDAAWRDLGDAVMAGRLRPLVHDSFPLAEAAAAQDALAADGHVGKLVLVP